jgi:hypothetical protein
VDTGLVVLLIVGAILASIVVLATLAPPSHHSPAEVASILRQFGTGELSVHLADDFIHTPIADPQLEAIRDRFERLVDGMEEWDPAMPFPVAALPELHLLIAEADALASAKVTADAKTD